MLKVIVVDDEMLIRVGVKSCIEWEKHGFEIVGQAEDGMQALELVEKTSPDIILTDIKMPNMDGLELIKAVREKYPGIKAIILSCYNEIEYVKAAMKMGAVDYILKLSMEPETLLEVLNRARQMIEKEREKDTKIEYLEEKLEKNLHLIKENLYKNMLAGFITPEELKEDLAGMGAELDSAGYLVISCSIDGYAGSSIENRIGNEPFLKYTLINILEDILAESCKGDVAEQDNGNYIVVMSFKKLDSHADMKKIVACFCKKVNNALKNYLNVSMSFGISQPFYCFEKIKEEYTKAQTALDHRFYSGKESIIFYSGINDFQDKVISFKSEKEKLLSGSLERLDADGAKGVIDRFISDLYSLRSYAPSKVRMAAVEILHCLTRTARIYNVEFESIISSRDVHPVDALMNAETILDIRNWFDEFVDRLVKYISQTRSNTERSEITLVKHYIADHIQENITLDKAAKLSNISKCYFSSIFKKQVGESFTDYVNKVKMEKAKELLLESDLRTYEVAERVGISDESYFSKLFKKYIGITPSEIKKSFEK